MVAMAATWKVCQLKIDAVVLTYHVSLPAKSAPTTPAALLLALGGGSQEQVSSLAQRLGSTQPPQGWILVTALKPRGHKQFDRLLEPLCRHLLKTFKPSGGKVHLTGVSNGAVTALQFALRSPASCCSLSLVAIGNFDERWARMLPQLQGIPVRLFVGDLELKRCPVSRLLRDHLRRARHVPEVRWHVVEGAAHSDIDAHMDLSHFWCALGDAQAFLTAEPTVQGPKGDSASESPGPAEQRHEGQPQQEATGRSQQWELPLSAR